MDFLKANQFEVRQMVEGSPQRAITIIDVLTAIMMTLARRATDFLLDDDKYLRFIASRARRVPAGVERQYWLDNLFRLYQNLSKVPNEDPEWIFLQAYVIDLSTRDYVNTGS
jgi:hypothetical protein